MLGWCCRHGGSLLRLLGLSGLLAALAEAAPDDVTTGPLADSVWINAMSRK